MEALLKFAPFLNTLLIVVAGLVFVMRLNESINRFNSTLERLTGHIDAHERRLTKIETVMDVRHCADFRDKEPKERCTDG